MPFHDRKQAGERLAAALRKHSGEPAVVYALPRGGVPVAEPVARALHAPLDLVLVRKIGVPFQPELAMGAVADGGSPVTVRNEDVIGMCGIREADFEAVRREELAEIERRRTAYLAGRVRPAAAGKLAIVIDDGIATGATTRAALRAVRALGPKRLILAAPVAPGEVIQSLKAEADEIVCLETHDPFGAIGLFYSDFRQVSDQEVVDGLAACAEPQSQATRDAAQA